MKNDDGQSSQATKRIQFLQSRLRPWFRCHEDELSQTGYDSRNAAAGKRPPIFLLDRQHRTAIPLAGSILSALSQSAAAQQSGCSGGTGHRSEEHTSELQSLMRISSAVFCLKKKKQN